MRRGGVEEAGGPPTWVSWPRMRSSSQAERRQRGRWGRSGLGRRPQRPAWGSRVRCSWVTPLGMSCEQGALGQAQVRVQSPLAQHAVCPRAGPIGSFSPESPSSFQREKWTHLLALAGTRSDVSDGPAVASLTRTSGVRAGACVSVHPRAWGSVRVCVCAVHTVHVRARCVHVWTLRPGSGQGHRQRFDTAQGRGCVAGQVALCKDSWRAREGELVCHGPEGADVSSRPGGGSDPHARVLDAECSWGLGAEMISVAVTTEPCVVFTSCPKRPHTDSFAHRAAVRVAPFRSARSSQDLCPGCPRSARTLPQTPTGRPPSSPCAHVPSQRGLPRPPRPSSPPRRPCPLGTHWVTPVSVGSRPPSLSLLSCGHRRQGPYLADSRHSQTLVEWHVAAQGHQGSGQGHTVGKRSADSRASSWPLGGPPWASPALGSAGCVHGVGSTWTREVQQPFGRHTARLGQVPDSRSCPLSPVRRGPRSPHWPGEAGTGPSLRLLPKKAARSRAGVEQAAVASLWPIFQPCPPPPACASATWPRHASNWASVPQATATVPLRPATAWLPHSRRPHRVSPCVSRLCLSPFVSVCIFLPRARRGHLSQGLF